LAQGGNCHRALDRTLGAAVLLQQRLRQPRQQGMRLLQDLQVLQMLGLLLQMRQMSNLQRRPDF
jgi:hypothetical protein